MLRSNRILVAGFGLLLLAVGTVPAETSPEAKEWIDRLHAAYDKGPFRVGFTATMTTEQMGQAINVSLSGTSVHKDTTHMNTQLTVKMALGAMNRDMSVLQVADGKTLWMQMEAPALGKQVMKVSVNGAEQVGAMGGGLGGGASDPVGQIREMARKFDFQLVGISDGLVTLKATPNAETRAELSAMPPIAEAMDQVTIVLDEKTAFPKSMLIGSGDPPFMTVKLDSFEYITEVADSLFVYAPPEGVQVMDLDSMIEVTDPAEK